MSKLLIATWVVVAVLALGLGIQSQEASHAQQRFQSCQAASAELMQLSLEGEANHAAWLTKGLQHLRSGETDFGFKTLDTLLLALVRTAEASQSEFVASRLADPRSYLDSVGDPWAR